MIFLTSQERLNRRCAAKLRAERERWVGKAIPDEGTTRNGLLGLEYGRVRSDRPAPSQGARWPFRGIFRSTLDFARARFPSRCEEQLGGGCHVAISRAAANVGDAFANSALGAKSTRREVGDDTRSFSRAADVAVGATVKGLPFFLFTAFVLLVALTVGGAARQGLGSDTFPELASLPLLAMALPRAWPILKRSPTGLALVFGVLALPFLQLIPLPYWVWTLLPGRQSVADILTTAGVPGSWRPISLLPGATERSLFSLLPAVAVFLSVLCLDRDSRKFLLLLAVGIGVLSAPLAMVQLLGGVDSGLYFFDVTNPTRGVGLFANANHFAAFEYSLLPLAAAVLSELRLRSLAFLLFVFGVVIPALLFGLTLSGSRSAVILGGLSLIAVVPILLGPEIAKWGRNRALAVAAVVSIVIIPLMAGLGLMAILTRFTTQNVAEDARWVVAAETWRAILNYLPFGAGVGTFPRVYPLQESASALIPEFVNRAHNDLLETLFEGGLGSLALLLAFLGWLFLTMRRILFGDLEVVGRQARAGVIVIALLLVHSLWDYPLRTIALETLFALCVALQFAPPSASEDHRGAWWLRLVRKKGRRRRRGRSRGPVEPIQEPAVTAVQWKHHNV
jgi:hypothetical protein